MLNEEWRDIPGYEGLYQVSNMGRLKSLTRKINYGKSERIVKGRIMKLSARKVGGYMETTLAKNGKQKTYRVYRLVMLAFVGECPPGKEVRHINCDTTDNRLCNLAYGTRSDNMNDTARLKRVARQKLTFEDAKQIREQIKNGVPQAALARKYGVSAATINSIHKNRNFKSAGEAGNVETD